MADSDNEDDFVLLLLVLQGAEQQLDDNVSTLQSPLAEHVREQRRLNTALPRDKARVTWDLFKDKVSATHFRRVFRMDEPCFEKLCSFLAGKVGEEVFRSEAFVLANCAGSDATVPHTSGEVKVALAMRLLAGGSHLDLVPLFDVSVSRFHTVFDDFMDWILLAMEFPLARWPREEKWSALESLANDFAEKSNGVFCGPFASLDGLAIRIRCPSLKAVPDPGNCCCRKGFYALNVQAMCDLRKRFLWCCPSDKGSTHDSTAFSGSRLCEPLRQVSGELSERGPFIAADSACALSPFVVTPHDTSEMDGDPSRQKDAFNFYLSSCGTYIECAFGELVMRWGSFWRTLSFDLKKCGRVIQAAVLLHNYITENREQTSLDSAHFREFNVRMDSVQMDVW